MMPFPEARQTIATICRPLGTEHVALGECAGRVLAHDAIARDDLVPFARASMDGYAVSAADLVRLPITLPLAQSVYAAPGTRLHAAGTATAIATGAAIPQNADCVIPFEDVDVHDGLITIGRAVAPGACIFPPGDDARRGDVLATRGTRLEPAMLALLAAAGIVRVAVYVRPIAAVICGGDELVGIDRMPAYGQIRDSNGVLLAAALTAAGAVVIPPVRIIDDREAVRAALGRAFEHAQVVVTTGGASVGERDFVKRACADIGVDFAFTSVALRPAKPTAFGRRGESVVAVLPGNPAAAFVAYHEFVGPAVRALAGQRDPFLPRVPARLAGSIRAKPGRHFAAFAKLAIERDGFVATPLENQCSSLTRTAAGAAGLLIVPPGPQRYGPGDRVAVDIIDWGRVITPAVESSAEAFALA